MKELFELEEKTKLELIFKNLDLTSVVKNLRTDSKKGPKGYNIKPIIRAFLAQRLENIPTRAALVRRLNSDPVFNYICGFGFYKRVPSEATLSRYFKKLSEANELDLLDLESIAIDASKLKSYERAKPKSQIDKENLDTPDWGAKLDSFKNKTTWYGWKVHLAVDTESELPLAITVTPANEADSNQALSLVQMVSEVITGINCGQTKYWVMDSGYDFTYIYESILFDYNSQAIIPINKRNAKQPPAGYYDFDSTPECSAGHKMVYWGHYKGDNKFRCPDVCGKVDCVHGSAWCSESNYGHVTKTRPKEDSRYVSTPHRGSKT
ncbi:MAG: transposase [Bacillota bacterium]